MKFITIKLRTIIFIILAIVLATTLLILVGATRSAGLWTSGQPNRLQPTYNIATEEQAVALTFDAISGGQNTSRIIEILNEFDVEATYFVSGFWAERYADELKALSEAGVEIGTLGNSHVNMSRLSSNIVRSELEASVRTIGNITNNQVALFRPPFGVYNDNLLNIAKETNLIPVMGNINLICDNKTPYQIASATLASLKAGSIIMLNSDCNNSVSALPAVIAGVHSRGMSFVTVSNLLNLNNSQTE